MEACSIWRSKNGTQTSFWFVLEAMKNYLKESELLYCLRQAPMNTCSSSIKIWGWAFVQKRCLNGSTIPMEVPTSDAKLTAGELNQPPSSRPAWQWRKLYHARKQTYIVPVALLPSFFNIPHLQYSQIFIMQARNAANKATNKCMGNFAGYCGTWSASEWLQLCTWIHQTYLRFTISKNLAWWVVTWRTSKITELSKLGSGHLRMDGPLPGQCNMSNKIHPFCLFLPTFGGISYTNTNTNTTTVHIAALPM